MKPHRARLAVAVTMALLVPPFSASLALAAPHAVALLGDSEPFGLISRRTVDRFARLLHLDKAQAESALTLYEGYSSAFRTAGREYVAECRHLPETGLKKPEEQAEYLAARRKARIEREKAIEASFFSDLRSLLTTSQTASWPAVERARRRERLLPGIISGENVDLIDLTESLHLSPAESAPIDEVLAAYELALDRALLDKAHVLNDEDPFNMGGEFSASKIMNRAPHTRDSGLAIRDLNETYARQIEAALPDARRTAFHAAFHSAAFPSVYSQSPGSRLLANVLKLPDLDKAQRDALDSLRKSYERDLAAANLKHEEVIKEAQTSKQSVMMLVESGGSFEVLLGKPEDNPVMKARKAKLDLDSQLRDRLDKILNATQLDALLTSKDSDSDEQIFMDSTAVMIRRGG